VRLVCKIWTKEAAFALGGQFMLRHYPMSTSPLRELTQFIVDYKLNHAFQVSLLKVPWIFCAGHPDGVLVFHRKVDAYYRQQHNVLYQTEMKSKFLRTSYPQFIVELRLEQMLRNQSDVDFLVSVVAVVTNLQRLALDFLRVTNKTLQDIPQAPFAKLKQLTLFSFRIHGLGDKVSPITLH